MKVVVTRDKLGIIGIWSGNLNPILENGVFEDWNSLYTETFRDLFDEEKYFVEIHTSEFKNLFGFTPRKGSKKEYNLNISLT